LEIAEGGACYQAHPSNDWLGCVAFGCGSADLIIFIPAKEFVGWLERFWTTELEDRFYWHVRIVGDKMKLTMDTKAGFKPIDVTQYLVK
jgi:hypothetical protein